MRTGAYTCKKQVARQCSLDLAWFSRIHLDVEEGGIGDPPAPPAERTAFSVALQDGRTVADLLDYGQIKAPANTERWAAAGGWPGPGGTDQGLYDRWMPSCHEYQPIPVAHLMIAGERSHARRSRQARHRRGWKPTPNPAPQTPYESL
jgi:hypothetical protein